MITSNQPHDPFFNHSNFLDPKAKALNLLFCPKIYQDEPQNDFSKKILDTSVSSSQTDFIPTITSNSLLPGFEKIQTIFSQRFHFTNKSYTSLSELENFLDFFPDGLLGEGMRTSMELILSKLMYGQIGMYSYFDLSRSNFVYPLLLTNCLATPSIPITIILSLDNLISLNLPSTVLSLNSLFIKRVALDALLLSTQAFHNSLALRKSYLYFDGNQFSTLPVIKNIFLALAGMYGLISTLIQADNLGRGAEIFPTLDVAQQKAVLKNRTIHLLPKTKNI